VYTADVKPVVQPGLTTGWTKSGCSFSMVERTVAVRSTRLSNRFEQVWQPVVSCKRGFTNSSLVKKD